MKKGVEGFAERVESERRKRGGGSKHSHVKIPPGARACDLRLPFSNSSVHLSSSVVPKRLNLNFRFEPTGCRNGFTSLFPSRK